MSICVEIVIYVLNHKIVGFVRFLWQIRSENCIGKGLFGIASYTLTLKLFLVATKVLVKRRSPIIVMSLVQLFVAIKAPPVFMHQLVV